MVTATETVASTQILSHPADAPPDLPRGRDLGRVVNLEATCRRYGRERVLEYADAYSVGDELSYAVLRDIKELDGFGWRELWHALEHGVDALEDPPESVVRLFADAEREPDWLDWEQLRRGAVAYWRSGAIVLLALTSLIGRGFKNYGGMKPTIFTGRLIDEKRVGRRMVETLRYIAAVTTPGAMRRDRDGFKYSIRLRMLHASVRWGCSRAEAWDWADWGLPVSSADNMGPPLEFSAGLIETLERVGIKLEPREREDIAALWRYIAFILGSPENLLMRDARDARERLEIMDALNHPPDDTNRLMLHSLVDYASREGIGYDPLPSWLAGLLTPKQRKSLTYGLMHAWSDDEVARQMEIPKTPYRHALKVMRPVFALRDALSRGLPEDDERACWRLLNDFARVTAVGEGESPLADPDEVARDIRNRAGVLRTIFGRPRQRRG